MRRTSRFVGSGLALLALAACTSTAKRSYELPTEQVSLAAREALISVGYPGGGLSGERSALWGFFIGDGGESVQVDLVSAGPRTEVTITSRKQFFGFLAQQHYSNLIAEYMDSFIRENGPLWKRPVNPGR